jgi:hypothetical protein
METVELSSHATQQEIARRYRSAWEDSQTLLRDNLDVTDASPKDLQDDWTRLQGGEVNGCIGPRSGTTTAGGSAGRRRSKTRTR